MSFVMDSRGRRWDHAAPEAAGHVEQALWRMMSFYDPPLDDLDAAMAADPQWLLPPVMKAGFLLSLTEPGLVPQAAALLDAAAPLEAGAPADERSHLAATRLVLEGRWQQACQVWDELLLAQPRDALALQWACLWDFYRGDVLQLRQRPARALPHWDESDPLYPYVLALHAFGLEENNLYPQAEEAGRRAIERGPWGVARVPWAVHAVAHAMEMQGRFDDGAAWLRRHQRDWAEGNGFAQHLWWHLGLFRLEGLDTAGVLRLVDNHLSGDSLQVTLHRLDAASLLWRLRLLGVDVGPRWRPLLEGFDLADTSAGYYAFNDAHVVLAMVGAGEPARADAWLARCAESAMQASGQRRTNHAMARDAGLPLMRALTAFGRGDFDAAVQSLYALRPASQRLGGSHAQRELIDLTLIAAAARCHEGTTSRAMGRAVLSERVMARTWTPLARHYGEQLGMRRAGS
jgi:tetratricopeptide (TPR) repeat protein